METSISSPSHASIALPSVSTPSRPTVITSHISSLPFLADENGSPNLYSTSSDVNTVCNDTQADSTVTPVTPNRKSAGDKLLSEFSQEWVSTLEREDKKSLAMFLCHILVSEFKYTWTNAAKFSADSIGKSERSVRKWRSDLIANNGKLPESKQGRYERSGILWSNEELNEKVREYVRANAAVKGRPNMTTMDFCKWVNKTLLPNSTLEGGFPRKIALETSRKWLHMLGFEVLCPKKGIFIDGHERPDVVQYQKEFLRRMVKIGFLHSTHAPTESAIQSLPQDIDPPTTEKMSKTVVFCHDESTFQSNEDQSLQWG